MSKFCGHCGSPADDNAMVCGNCGTPFTPVQPAYQAPAQPVYQAPVQPGYNPAAGAPVMNQNIPGVTTTGKNNLIPKIIAAVLAVVIVIVGIVAVAGGGKDYEAVVKDFTKAVETGNGKKMVKRFHKNYEDDKDEILDGFEYINEKFCEDLDSDKIKVTYKITDTDEISKSVMEDEYDIRKPGVRVEFKLTAKARGDKNTYDIIFILINDGGWKIIDYYDDF